MILEAKVVGYMRAVVEEAVDWRTALQRFRNGIHCPRLSQIDVARVSRHRLTMWDALARDAFRLSRANAAETDGNEEVMVARKGEFIIHRYASGARESGLNLVWLTQYTVSVLRTKCCLLSKDMHSTVSSHRVLSPCPLSR